MQQGLSAGWTRRTKAYMPTQKYTEKKIKAYVFGHMNKYLYLLPFVSTGRFWCN